MTTGYKAKRATVAIGSLSVDGSQTPDSSYRMSQTQVGESFGLSEKNAREFLQSKGFKALVGKGYTSAISEAEPDALREQVACLEQQLRDAGLEPWQLPPTER